jgi:hypothetical protein
VNLTSKHVEINNLPMGLSKFLPPIFLANSKPHALHEWPMSYFPKMEKKHWFAYN